MYSLTCSTASYAVLKILAGAGKTHLQERAGQVGADEVTLGEALIEARAGWRPHSHGPPLGS